MGGIYALYKRINYTASTKAPLKYEVFVALNLKDK
jgi:hypothetical protein